MYTNDQTKANKLNSFVLPHSKTEEYNNLNLSFVEVLCSCCRLITERKDVAGDVTINKWLYFILNLQPLLQRQENEYLATIKNGNTESKIDKLKKQLCFDLGSILKWLSTAPIAYDKPEEDLAKLHFSGAFGRGVPDSSQYGFKPSWAVSVFDLNIYKQIRCAFSVEDLEHIESREMKLAVLYLLTGYYIDQYYQTVSSVLRTAGLNYVITYHGTQQDKLFDYLYRLSHNRYKEYLEDADVNPPSKTEKKLLINKNFCKLSKRDKLIKFLDSLTTEFKIGTRACSKRDFANIVFVLTEQLSCWEEKRYATSKRTLSQFYGLAKEPTYKVSDCSAFLKTEDGKRLRKMIKKFNESLEQ